MSAIGLIIYSFGFNTMPPNYICTIQDGSTVSCTREEICDSTMLSGVSVTEWQVDWDSEHSLHNWYDKMDLVCTPKTTIASIGTAFFAGWTLTLFFLPRLADIYGRKLIWRVDMACQFACM